MKKRFVFFGIFLLVLVGFVFSINFLASESFVAGQTHYIRSGTGLTEKCGDDWNTACDDLPADLIRGYTYYVADGHYNLYSFNDPEDGEKWITIKKAISTDHGTSTGWQESYGDNNAIFDGTLTFRKGYYSIDGQTRNENDWTDSSSYGFWIQADLETHYYGVRMTADGPGVKNVNFSYIDISAGMDETNCENKFSGMYLVGGQEKMYLGYNYIHGVGIPIKVESVTDVIIEKNYVGPSWSKEAIRGTGTLHNYEIRYNKFVDNGAGACVSLTADIGVWEGQTKADNWFIYGNIFHDTGKYPVMRSSKMIFGGSEEHEEVVSNWKIYNNVMYNMNGHLDIVTRGGENNLVANNILAPGLSYKGAESAPVSCGGTNTECKNNWCYNIHDYNAPSGFDCELLKTNHPTTIVGTENPFVDVANLDFRLKESFSGPSPKDAGMNLGLGFDNVDLYGNTRGADGSWDVGAYELVSGEVPPPPQMGTNGEDDDEDDSGTTPTIEYETQGECVSNQCEYTATKQTIKFELK